MRNRCPVCSGQLMYGADEYGEYIVCRNCGWRRELGVYEGVHPWVEAEGASAHIRALGDNARRRRGQP